MPAIPTHAQASPAAIALGSNLGDRRLHLRRGVEAIGRLPGTRLTAESTVIETPALVAPGAPPGPAYLNAAVLVETRLPPRALLDALLDIERAEGRDRAGAARWAARTLDLDLLLYGGLVAHEPGLTLPHPELHRRRFVLEPLAQIAPAWVHPVLGASVIDLLAIFYTRTAAPPARTPPAAPSSRGTRRA